MGNKGMSKTCWLMTIGLVLVAATSAIAQTKIEPLNLDCSNRTLSGDYGVLIEGTFLANGWTLRTASMMHFDGKGKVTTSDYVVLNGTPLPGDWSSKSGTYSVNRNCTGTFVLEGVINTHFTISNSGKEIRGVTDGDAITFSGSRVP